MAQPKKTQVLFDEDSGEWRFRVPGSRKAGVASTARAAKSQAKKGAREQFGDDAEVATEWVFPKKWKKRIEHVHKLVDREKELGTQFSDARNESAMALLKLANDMRREIFMSVPDIADVLRSDKNRVMELTSRASDRYKRTMAMIEGRIKRGTKEWYHGERGQRGNSSNSK